MVRCRQCNAELIEQAHFCNACGLPQNPPKPELEISTLIEQKTPDSMSLKPARSIKPVDKQLTKTSDNVSIRPKTVTRPPVFPTRPTNNSAKSPAAIEQINTSQPVVSSEPPVATTLVNSPSSAKMPEEPA